MLVIKGRERDLGGFSVRRVLPFALHRMVGPFIFFDHMGPVSFAAGKGIDVRPHPHINLATVTYLFEGKIHHRDSLGSDQMIEPGAMNWMTAGTGIVHSERTPPDQLASGQKLNGIQLWVALPLGDEEIAPAFTHHPKEDFPVSEQQGVACRLLLGKLWNQQSPVKTHSEMFYAEVRLKSGERFTLAPGAQQEMGVYVASGLVKIQDQDLESYSMAVAEEETELKIEATQDSILMVLGGKPVGPRSIYWNFVSSSPERIEEAKKLWVRGPQFGAPRFAAIPGDDKEFIPLPE